MTFNKSKHSHLLLLSGLFILLFFLPHSDSDSNIDPIQFEQINENIPQSQYFIPPLGHVYDYDSIAINTWTQKCRANSLYVDHELEIQFKFTNVTILAGYFGAYSSLYSGLYHIQFWGFSSSISEVSTAGSQLQSSPTLFQCYNTTSAPAMGWGSYSILTANGLISLKSYNIFQNTSANSYFSDSSLNFTITFSNDTKTDLFAEVPLAKIADTTLLTPTWGPSSFRLLYEIEPEFTLNSTYYNQKNTILETYTITSPASDTTPDFGWIEQSWDSIMLKHPQYKVRIRDLENNLLYEDTSIQTLSMSAIRRTINLDSLRIQNNADEPINTAIYNNTGYYQGAYSFDKDTLNQKPSYVQNLYNSPYIISNYQTHCNVLQINSTQVDYPTAYVPIYNSSDVEFWLNVRSTDKAFYLSMRNLFYGASRVQIYVRTTGVIDFLGTTTASSVATITLNAWNHFRISAIKNGIASLYINQTLVSSLMANNYDATYFALEGTTNMTSSLCLDAIDYSNSENYYVNRNRELNNTDAIWNIIRNCNYNHSGHYQGVQSFNDATPHTQYRNFNEVSTNYGMIYVESEYENHKNVLVMNHTAPGVENNYIRIDVDFPGNFEFWLNCRNFQQFRIWSNNFNLYFEPTYYLIYNLTHFTSTSYGLTPFDGNWHHFRLSYSASGLSLYIDQTLIKTHPSYEMVGSNAIQYLYIKNDYQYGCFYLDAIDYSTSSSTGYFLNRNILQNQSTALETWNAYPTWTPENYKNSEDVIYWGTGVPSGFTMVGTPTEYSTINDISGHDNVIELTSDGATEGFYYLATATSHLYYSYWICPRQTNQWITCDIPVSGGYAFALGFLPSGYIGYYNGTGSWQTTSTTYSSQWYHVVVDATQHSNTYVYLNDQLIISTTQYLDKQMSILRFIADTATANFYFDALVVSDSLTECFMNLLENTTASPLAMNYTAAALIQPNLTLQINPYSYSLSNFTAANYLYRIADLYNNTLDVSGITSAENEIIYTPPNYRENFISLADQQNQYLDWENYRIYLNGTQIYDNRFYLEIDDNVNISIYSRFGTYLTSTIHIVTRDDNWIPINLTRYALKIYNQQSAFLHYNITLNPTYYPSASVFWSEWLAPNEIGSNYLYPDYYIVTLMKNETGTPEYVNYNLPFTSGDDVILINSANTIFAVLQNINNLKTSVNEQFNYVSLNFTNTNSRIGNITTIISIEFNGENITLENFLLSQMNYFSFLTSNLTNVLQFVNNTYSLVNDTIQVIVLENQNKIDVLNGSINSLYSLSSNTYSLINDTIQVIVLENQNKLDVVGGSINTINLLTQNSFEYLNSSINNSITWMAQNFTFIGGNISSNQLELLTQFSIISSNITNNTLDIESIIFAINSSISDLVADSTNNVLLVNDSIYTATLNISQNLAIDSTNILGNLSITFQQNEFLTEIYKKTMFNDLLYNSFNWTDLGYNWSKFADEVGYVEFFNNCSRDALELYLRYQEEVVSLTVGVKSPEMPMLPASGVEYRVKSTATGEYLSNWEPVDSTNITIGYYDEIIPATPDQIKLEIKDYLLVALFAVVFMAAVTVLYIKTKAQLDLPESRQKKKIPGVRDSSDLYFGSETRIYRPKASKSNSIVIVGTILILVFIIVYLLIRFGV